MDTVVKMNQVHAAMKDLYSVDPEENRFADELSNFLTYIVYGVTNVANNNVKYNVQNNLSFSQYIDDSFRQLLYQECSSLFQINSKELNSYQLGEVGEQAIGQVLMRVIEKEQKGIEGTLQENLEKIIIGNVNATILTKGIIDKIGPSANQEIQSQLRLKDNPYGVFQSKYGKIDINMGNITVSTNETSLTKKLKSISASVKNYTSSEISLESVNRQKAYQAIMAYIHPELSIDEINGMYEYYYQKQKNKNIVSYGSKSVSAHFMHIAALYGLTGFNQTYIFNKALIESGLGAKYLIANSRNKQRVYVFPTSAIATSLFNPQSALKWNNIFSFDFEASESKDAINARKWKESETIHVKLKLYNIK